MVPPWHGAAACSPRGPSTAKDLPLPQSGGTLSPSAGGSAGSPVLPPAPRCFWASLRPCSALSKPQFPSLMQEAQRGIELQRAESCSAPGSCRCLCSNPMAGDPSPPAPAPCPPHICIHAEQIRAGTKRRGCLKPPQPSSPPPAQRADGWAQAPWPKNPHQVKQEKVITSLVLVSCCYESSHQQLKSKQERNQQMKLPIIPLSCQRSSHQSLFLG